jgi:IS30 family transposase
MTKKYSQLSLAQRYQIEALRSSGQTLQQIAEQLGFNRSTISRELYRNTPQGGQGRNHYDPIKAQEKTLHRHRKKNKQIRFTNKMKRKAKKWMEQDKLSPEFISAKGKIEFGDFVSHEVLYQWIWQCKFSERAEHRDYKMLYKELKHGKRRSKRGSFKRTRGQIPKRISIEDRPEVIMKRKRLGDLETDLMLGKNHQAGLLVMVDRATLKTYLTKIVSKQAHYIATCMNRKLVHHKNWIKTITFDNDSAFTNHERVSQVIG